MTRDKFFIVTGAIGAGKTTIIKELGKRGFQCTDEPAREILREQRAIGGKGLPEDDAGLFTGLMLSRMMQQYTVNESHNDTVFFDRGIPDLIAYSLLLVTPAEPSSNASLVYRYNKHVFHMPAWEEIYENDDERKAAYGLAEKFGSSVKNIYEDLGYEIICVPKVSVAERVNFITEAVEIIRAGGGIENEDFS